MRKIRVLVVDDSVVIRRLLTNILSEDPDIEVVGTAPNGRIALAKLPQVNPDLVTLDIEMPELDGLGTLPELRKDYPALPVIMFSTLCARGAVSTLDALARGATDYVTKPANVGSVSAGMQSVKEQLLPKIKSLCPFAQPAEAAPPRPRRPITKRPPPKSARCDIVAIGSSTGGPQALAAVVSKIPANFPVPVIITQHMPPVFTTHLAERLNQESPCRVVEATNGMQLVPGQVLVAQGDFHLELRRKGTVVTTFLHKGQPENSCRPSVDVMFSSAAKTYGSACLSVVLTGMGHDGLRGAEEIVDAGGKVIVQDEKSSVVWGMPRAVAEAGLATKVMPLNSISDELQRQVAIERNTSCAC